MVVARRDDLSRRMKVAESTALPSLQPDNMADPCPVPIFNLRHIQMYSLPCGTSNFAQSPINYRYRRPQVGQRGYLARSGPRPAGLQTVYSVDHKW